MPGCHGRRGRRSKSLPPPSADRSDSADDTETAEHYHAAARTLKNVKASKGLAPATGRVALADTPRVQHAEYNTSWTSASLQAHSRYSGEGSDIASNETCGAWDYGNAAQPAPGSDGPAAAVAAGDAPERPYLTVRMPPERHASQLRPQQQQQQQQQEEDVQEIHSYRSGYSATSVTTYSACHLRHDSARSMHMRAPSFQVGDSHPVTCLWNPQPSSLQRITRRLRIQAYRYHVTCGFPAAEPWEAAIGHTVLAGLWALLGWKAVGFARWAAAVAGLLGR